MRKIAETFCVFLFTLLLFSVLSFTALATEKLYRIQGKIISNLTEKEISNIPVVLLRFDTTITDGPPITPIQRSETNEKGEYIFQDIKKEENIEYLIGALIQGNRISSNRIQLKDNLKETLNLEYFGIPSLEKEIRYNLEKINYLGNLFVFNLLKNKIRITEVIYLQNESETFISSQKNPLKRKLPKLQKNFQTFEIKDEKLTATLENNFAVLTYTVPSGESNLYFEYDISMPQKTLSYTQPFLKKNNSVSILYDPRYLEVEVVGQNTTKNQDGKYLLKRIELKDANTEVLNFIVKTKFANRSFFYFIVAGFFCLSVIGMVFFLYSKKHSRPLH